MKVKILFSSFIFFSLLCFSEGRAFSCADTAFKGNYNKASHVFFGKVTNIQEGRQKNTKIVSFAVLKTWKGIFKENVNLFIGDDGYFSSNPFVKSKSYLVFAQQSKDADNLTSSSCDPHLEITLKTFDFVTDFITQAGKGKENYVDQSSGTARSNQKTYRLE